MTDKEQELKKQIADLKEKCKGEFEMIKKIEIDDWTFDNSKRWLEVYNKINEIIEVVNRREESFQEAERRITKEFNKTISEIN